MLRCNSVGGTSRRTPLLAFKYSRKPEDFTRGKIDREISTEISSRYAAGIYSARKADRTRRATRQCQYETGKIDLPDRSRETLGCGDVHARRITSDTNFRIEDQHGLYRQAKNEGKVAKLNQTHGDAPDERAARPAPEQDISHCGRTKERERFSCRVRTRPSIKEARNA